MRLQPIRLLVATICRRPVLHLGTTALVSALLFFSNTGCRQIAQYRAAEVPRLPAYNCEGVVNLYPAKAARPQVGFDYHGVGKRPEIPELVWFDNREDPVPLYRWTSPPQALAPWVAEGFIPGELRGSWLVRVGVEDAGIKQNLMTLQFDDPAAIETVWVAFDQRASRVPEWLDLGFDPYSTGPEGKMKSTRRTSSDEAVSFNLWKLDGDVQQTLVLGGNDDPTAQWPGQPGSQYLVFVRPRPEPDLSATPVPLGVHKAEMCHDVSKPGADLTDFVKKWTKDNPGWNWSISAGLLRIEGTSCSGITRVIPSGEVQTKYCVGNRHVWNLINDWPLESRATVDPSGSVGRIGLDDDEPTQVPLVGEVSFRTLHDGRLLLDQVSLFSDPFTSGGHAVSRASFGQEASVEATCDGQSFPHRLCAEYLVNEQELRLFAAAHVGSHLYSATITNEEPIRIKVDLNQRIFYFACESFTGSVPLENGSEIRIEASFDFLGRFQNFAPVALANVDVGEDRFPCVDNRRGRVRLNAGASLDEEGSLASYRWLEDAGLATQRLLGSSVVTEVDMAVGTHDATLFVEDQEGVISFTTKSIEVYDDVLDVVSFPPDVWALSSGDPAGTQLTVPEATGADSCAGQVLVLGDLPPEDLFPEGLSLVDWSVDDGHGNVARDTQKVFVLPPPFHPPPIAEIDATPLVAFDGTLYVDYGTLPQGNGVAVDEYLVVTRYDGAQWSIDSRGRIGEQDQLRPRSSGLVLGVSTTSGQVALTAPGDLFFEEGPYAIEYLLVRPGESPLDRTSVVGWDGVGWTLVP